LFPGMDKTSSEATKWLSANESDGVNGISHKGDQPPEQLSQSQAAQFLFDECRMVLPGIQTLLGFQLIAVFSPGFDEKLSEIEQHLHLLAIFLVAVAVVLVMTPAAYSRQAHPKEISEGFIRTCTRLLLWSMIPLAIGICLEMYLIAEVILRSPLSAVVAAVLFAVFVSFWFVLPRSHTWRNFLGRHQQPPASK